MIPGGRRGEGFPRASRIQRRPDFLAVQQSGERIVLRDVVVVHRAGRSGSPVRVGLTVSRKVGNAVARNRVKRQLREGVRTSPAFDALVGVDIVFIARPSAGAAPSQDLCAQARTALARVLRARPGPVASPASAE